MFENLGGAELMLVFLVILIFFGPKKIPELASSFGKGLRKFREAKAGMEEQFRTAIKEPMDTMRQAQSNFNRELADSRKGLEDRVNTMLHDETQSMKDSGDAVKTQIEEAVKALEAQNTPTLPPTQPPIEVYAPTPHAIVEAVPGGVKIHKLS